MNFFADFFKKYRIKYFGAVKYDDTLVINQRLLERTCHHEKKTVVVFAVPYFMGGEKRNISEYAVARDYHIYFSELYENMRAAFYMAYPENHITCYADASPFNEREYAERGGIGKRGLNRLIINPEYGSYIFIGTVVCDLDFRIECITADNPRRCINCTSCIKACPSPEKCLSAITQRKGNLTEEEKALMKKYCTAWGCDVCQQVCPANSGIPQTEVEFFRQDRIPYLTSDILMNISDDEFALRAFAWKGKGCVMRNVEILENE